MFLIHVFEFEFKFLDVLTLFLKNEFHKCKKYLSIDMFNVETSEMYRKQIL